MQLKNKLSRCVFWQFCCGVLLVLGSLETLNARDDAGCVGHLRKSKIHRTTSRIGFGASTTFDDLALEETILINQFKRAYPDYPAENIQTDFDTLDAHFHLNIEMKIKVIASAHEAKSSLESVIQAVGNLRLVAQKAADARGIIKVKVGPEPMAFSVRDSDLMEVYFMHAMGALKQDPSVFVAECVSSGAHDSTDVLLASKFSVNIQGSLNVMLKHLQAGIFIEKRRMGFGESLEEKVYPTYREAVTLVEVMFKIPKMNSDVLIMNKIREYHDLAVSNDEFDSMNDFFGLLSQEYGVTFATWKPMSR